MKKAVKANTPSRAAQAHPSPQDALNLLKEGNQRFVANKCLHRNPMEQVQHTAKGQNPFAVVLGCMDSRVPAELIFDLGIGDIFNIRIAGNIVNTDVLGSMEFACKEAGAKAIVVLGHNSCGAIEAACSEIKMEHLTGLLEKVKPVITAVADDIGDHDMSQKEYLQKISEMNIYNSLRIIKEQSLILDEMVKKGEIIIVGAMYNVSTGQVQFLN